MKTPKISALLKARIELEGSSTRRLATQIGLSPGTVQNLIDGTVEASLPTRIKIATALGVPIEDVSESGQNIPESLRSRQGGQIAPRPTSGGLTSVKVAALEGLAEKFKEIGDTEFYELMGTVSRALDELERKRLSGELKPPWQDEEGGRRGWERIKGPTGGCRAMTLEGWRGGVKKRKTSVFVPPPR